MKISSGNLLVLSHSALVVNSLNIPPLDTGSLEPRQFPDPPSEVCGHKRTGGWEEIGSGGYGYVYKTVVERYGTVAVKMGSHATFDILIGNQLAKDNLFDSDHHTKIYDLCGELGKERQYVIMELLDGKNLQAKINEGAYKGDDIAEAELDIRNDVCGAIDGIKIMHEKSLAHGDAQAKNFVIIKPDGKGDDKKASAWVDYDSTRRIPTNSASSDIAGLLRITMAMAGTRASDRLKQLARRPPGSAQELENMICGDSETIPLLQDRPPRQGKTLGIGLRQTYACSLRPTESCRDHSSNWFFFTTPGGTEPASLCEGMDDYTEDTASNIPGEGFFDAPSWPAGIWSLILGGEYYTYRCNGQNAGALFRSLGDTEYKVGDCWGDLTLADPMAKICSTSGPSGDAKFEKRRRVVGCDY